MGIGNLILGYNNFADNTTLSGGNWQAGLPLANLKNRYLNLKTRSTNAANNSTVLVVDLGSVQNIMAFGAIATNISKSGATYRLRSSNDSGFATVIYDSGVLSADKQTPNLIIGIQQPSGSSSSSTTTTVNSNLLLQNGSRLLPLILGSTTTTTTTTITSNSVIGIDSRYWRLEIFDSANVNGYIEIGRLFIGRGFSPQVNFVYGWSTGYRSNTNVVTSLGGVDFFDKRPARRATQLSINWLTDAEFDSLITINKTTDVYGEVLIIPKPDDTLYCQNNNFLARLERLDPLTNPYLDLYSANYELLEIV